jgi:hypothetical protein
LGSVAFDDLVVGHHVRVLVLEGVAVFHRHPPATW